MNPHTLILSLDTDSRRAHRGSTESVAAANIGPDSLEAESTS
jgi:hypothetical protein